MLNFLALLQMVSAIVQTVQTVETIMPKSPGTEKLRAATASVLAKVNTAQAAIPQVQGVISAVVALCNVTGVFKK